MSECTQTAPTDSRSITLPAAYMFNRLGTVSMTPSHLKTFPPPPPPMRDTGSSPRHWHYSQSTCTHAGSRMPQKTQHRRVPCLLKATLVLLQPRPSEKDPGRFAIDLHVHDAVQCRADDELRRHASSPSLWCQRSCIAATSFRWSV